MAKQQGDIRYLQGVFDSTTRQFLGISDPSSPGDGVDFDVPVYSDAQVEAGATGVVASTASGDLVAPDGRPSKVKYTSTLSPVIVDGFYSNAASYSISGGFASASDFTPVPCAQIGKVLATTTSASTTTSYIGKTTTASFVPSRMGVIAALVAVNGIKSGRVLNMRDGSLGNSANFILSDNAATPLIRDGYMWMAANISEFSGFKDLTTAQTISPRIGVQLAGNTGVTTVAPGPLICNAPGTPKILMSFDDCTSDQMWAFDLMTSLGLVGDIHVPSANIGGVNKLTLSQLRDLKSRGFAICADSTPDDSITSTDIPTAIAGLNQVRDYLVSNGLASDGSENHGCWTNNNWDEARCSAFEKAGMLTMRTTTGGITSTLSYTLYDEYGLGSIAMTIPSWSSGFAGLGSSVDNFQTALNYAISRNSTIFLHFHTFVDSGASGTAINKDVATQAFNLIAQHVKAGLIRNMNRTEWYRTVNGKEPPAKF